MISVAILSEIAWFLETRFVGRAQWTVMDDLRNGAYTLDWLRHDIERIYALTRRYADLPLGLADAAVIACAERHNGKILTTDYRHFSVVERGEGTISVQPIL
jgi:predicted nucleic acid-binding protein